MLKIRVIPLLLLKGWGLEKGQAFQHHQYIGCATNAARVFNNFNVDEIILLDIVATEASRGAQLKIINDIAAESFMPITVGGGVRQLADIRALLNAGADRVVINTAAVETPALISAAAAQFGSQCIVVAIDAKRQPPGGYEVYTHAGRHSTGLDPVAHAQAMERAGAGEILITAIERDGTMQGYDLELTRQVADAVSIPVIAGGGAGHPRHFAEAIDRGHASAVAAGAMLVFFGPRRTVLINYPTERELIQALGAERVRPRDKRGLWWP